MLSPGERFLESSRLWETYLALGGSTWARARYSKPFLRSKGVPRERSSWGDRRAYFTAQRNFSRDLDLLILADATNLQNLIRALDALDAEVIAVPPLDERHLSRGHAVHLRCRRDDVAGCESI